MKLLKIVKRLMTCMTVASVAALTVGAAKAQGVTLRGASLFDNNHAYSKTLIKLGELVNASGQKVTFDLRGDSAQSPVNEITAAGGDAFCLKGDLTKNDDVTALVTKTRNSFGDTIHGLVHVTGGLVARKKVDEMDEARWNHVMDLNATSYFHMINAVEPFMRDGSSIVGFASQAGRDGGGPGAVAHAASKGAAMTMARGFAKELAPRIRVNAICPGMIDTDFYNLFTKPEVRANVANITPLKREGTSGDTAILAVFLISDQSAFMTGTCLDINGGMFFS